MSKIKKYNNNLAKEIRERVIEKQLNVLIGSGCSAKSMLLMRDYEFIPKKNRNDVMINHIIIKSKISLMSEQKIKELEKYPMIKKIIEDLESYTKFFTSILELLNISNSRQVPRAANIFTTNYDLYIEMAINKLQSYHRIVFNDGANGYFNRILDATNYNRVVAYKGLNDNYISEIPSINLIKSHGSVNWKREEDTVIVLNKECDSPMVVPPTGYESQETFLNNYFHEMLRVFQLELDKPQTVLLVIGFSFQDQHIAKMINRALQNPELIIYIFVYKGDDGDIKKKLKRENTPSNLKLITPSNIFNEEYQQHELKKGNTEENNKDENDLVFTLDNLTEVLNNPEVEIEISEV